MAFGTLASNGAATFHTARTIRVSTETPIGYHLDGDYMGEATTFEVKVNPAALEVAVSRRDGIQTISSADIAG